MARGGPCDGSHHASDSHSDSHSDRAASGTSYGTERRSSGATQASAHGMGTRFAVMGSLFASFSEPSLV
ncbi:hypothetical protein GCM10023212_11770 [Luteolibacter yonseiensis]